MQKKRMECIRPVVCINVGCKCLKTMANIQMSAVKAGYEEQSGCNALILSIYIHLLEVYKIYWN